MSAFASPQQDADSCLNCADAWYNLPVRTGARKRSSGRSTTACKFATRKPDRLSDRTSLDATDRDACIFPFESIIEAQQTWYIDVLDSKDFYAQLQCKQKQRMQDHQTLMDVRKTLAYFFLLTDEELSDSEPEFSQTTAVTHLKRQHGEAHHAQKKYTRIV